MNTNHQKVYLFLNFIIKIIIIIDEYLSVKLIYLFINLGTDAERLTLYRAVRSTPTAKRYYAVPAPENEDLIFKLEDLERVNIGEPFNVTVNITNKSSQLRTVRAILWAGSVYYNGVKANLVKRAEGTFVMEPNATEQLKLHINVDDYLDELVEYSIMKINAIATVQETNQTWADEDDFQVIKPTIKIEVCY